jgi:hypothetical protein
MEYGNGYGNKGNQKNVLWFVIITIGYMNVMVYMIS